MRSNILLAVVSLFFLGCTKENTLVFSNKKYEKTSEIQESENHSIVTIDIPFVVSENIVSDSINNAIYEFIQDVIYLDDEPKDFSSYEELMTSFIAFYEELKKEYPKEIGWEAEIKGKVVFQSEKFLNIRMEYYIFTGGAHGYFGVKSLFFDTQTGKKLTQKDLFSDIEKFTLFAEKSFMKEFGIDKNQSINSKGFMFEGDTFHLPENIFFTKDGVLFVYNIYEIASYAEGIKEFKIPYKDVKPFLKLDIGYQ